MVFPKLSSHPIALVKSHLGVMMELSTIRAKPLSVLRNMCQFGNINLLYMKETLAYAVTKNK